jgi:hypothetical protein
MTHEQFQLFLDRHGADPARWPDAERAAVKRLIARDTLAHAAFEAARRLDDALARRLRTAQGDDASAARIMARLSTPLPRQKVPFWRLPGILLDWQFAPAWPRVAALACCAAIGFGIGLAGLDRPFDRLDAPFSVASRDLGSIVFEPESLTGARP